MLNRVTRVFPCIVSAEFTLTLRKSFTTIWNQNSLITLVFYFNHSRIMVLPGILLWCYQIDWTFCCHDIRYDHGRYVHFQYYLYNLPLWIHSSILLPDQKHRSKFFMFLIIVFIWDPIYDYLLMWPPLASNYLAPADKSKRQRQGWGTCKKEQASVKL